MFILNSDLEYMKTVNTMMRSGTLSLACHKNSVLNNTAIEISVLTKIIIKFNNIFFKDDFSLRAL